MNKQTNITVQIIPAKQARISYRISGENKHQYINYSDEIDLLERVFNFEVMQKYHVCVYLVTDIANKIRFGWCSDMAHYCFAKGRITPDQFADYLDTISQKTEIETLT